MKATYTTVCVAKELIQRPRDQRWGTELRELLKLQAGTLYPILGRMEDVGWLSSEWESDASARADTEHPGRSPRRYYTVTKTGLEALTALVAQWDGTRVVSS